MIIHYVSLSLIVSWSQIVMLNDNRKLIMGSFSRYRSHLFTVNYRISIPTTLATTVKRLVRLVDRDCKGMCGEHRWLAVHPTTLSTPVFFDPCCTTNPRSINNLLYVKCDVKLGTCESEIFVRIESRIKSAATI